jgi:hypothetical protein
LKKNSKIIEQKKERGKSSKEYNRDFPELLDKNFQTSQELVVHIYNPNYLEAEIRRFKASPRQTVQRPYLEKTQHKNRTGGVKTDKSFQTGRAHT